MRALISLLLLLSLTTVTWGEQPATAVSDFGFRYFRLAADGKENVVVSPLSIHASLSMLALGADGPTRKESLEVLGLDDKFVTSYKHFLATLVPESGTLVMASKLWPSQKFGIKAGFQLECLNAFGAVPEALDYGESELARKTINEWVRKKTANLIPELLPSGGIDRLTDLVLTNALHFEAPWETPFFENQTVDRPFQTPDHSISIPTMQGIVERCLLLDTPRLQAVSLPYADSKLAMAVVVPKKVSDARKLPKEVDRELLAALQRAPRQKVRLWMPKFTLTHHSKPLATLRKMGLRSLLGSSPDLTRITDTPGLAVSACFHSAVVKVDEVGTEATAATVFILTRSVAELFEVNRSFVFVIYETDNLAPLFVGHVLDPRS